MNASISVRKTYNRMKSASNIISAYVKPALKRISDKFPHDEPEPGPVAEQNSDQARTRTPLLSIVVPVYNVEGYIRETLDSLLSQTLSDWEAIIVDDGSTDSSPRIIEEYSAHDDRFKVIRQNNAGLGAARNTGIRAAVGTFLTFLDSDDIIPPNAYKTAVKTLKRTKSDFAIGAVERISRGKRITPKWTAIVHSSERTKTTLDAYPDMMMDIVACNRVFNRKFWLNSVGEFPAGVAYEDHRVMVTAAVRAKSIDVLAETTYLWRIREDNTSISQRKNELQNFLDRIRAKDETFRVLKDEASESAFTAWITRLMDTDIPLFAAHALASGQEYRDHAEDFAKRYVALAEDEVWNNVRWHQRVKTLLMAAGRWNDLDVFLTKMRNKVDVPGSRRDLDKIVLDLSSFDFDFGFVPSGRRILGERLTPLNARISSAEWTELGLKVAGFAYISNLEPDESDDISMAIVNSKTGRRINLESVQPSFSDLASRHANDEAFDYGLSGFEALIPWNDFMSIVTDEQFDMKCEWRIEVTRRSGPIERTGTADTVLRSGSGGAFTQHAVPGTSFSILLHRYKRSFSIRFRPIHATLTSVFETDGVISGEILVSISPTELQTNLPKAIVAPGPVGAQNSAALVPVGESQSSRANVFAFEGMRTSALLEASRLQIDFAGSSSKAVTWGLPETEYKFATGLVFKKTPFGLVDVKAEALSPVAVSIECSSNVISVRIRFAGTDDSLHSCTLRSTTSLETIEGRITTERNSDDTATLSFDTSVRNSSGAALRDTFSVFANEDQVVPAVQLTRSFPTSFLTDFYRVESTRGSASAGRPLNLRFSAPLHDSEVGSWNQKQLRRWYQETSFDEEANSVFFQCYRGEIASDNQLAIHNELTRRNSQVVTYWGVADGSVPLPTGAVSLIIGSEEWYRKLGSVKYLCNNIDFDHFFQRRPYQSFLQTFHGHAFKSMGKSFWMSKGYTHQQVQYEITRRQSAWTTALMPNRESISYYVDEYNYDGEYLVTGYPRNDAISNTDPEVARTRVADFSLIGEDTSKWVLYAPTWREAAATGAWSAKIFDQLDIDSLAESLGEGWTILVRGHGFNSREGQRMSRSATIVDVTDYPEVNDLIVACDAAVLDYSSLRFDWAITRKPMVFFVPDMEEYFQLRPGLFEFEESAPGALVTTTAQVAEELLQSEEYTARFGSQLDAFNRRFNSLSDGHAAERVVESFFEDLV